MAAQTPALLLHGVGALASRLSAEGGMPCAAPTNRLGSPNNPQGGQGRVRRIGDPGARGPGRAQRRDHLLVDPLPRGKDRYAGWVLSLIHI